MASTSLRAAIPEVAGRDPVLAQLVARVGPIRHRPRDPAGPFGALVRAIVFQQLAGRAAQAIYARLQTAVGGTLTPEALTATPDEVLRAAGLSANKLASLRDLSARVLDGTVVLARTSRRSDEELVARLTSVRGIGRWTAEMYLMFQLRRPDVWPVDDLGVRRATGSPGASTRRRRRSSSIRWASGSARTDRSSPAIAGRPCRCCGPGRPTPRCGDHLNGTVTGPGSRR